MKWKEKSMLWDFITENNLNWPTNVLMTLIMLSIKKLRIELLKVMNLSMKQETIFKTFKVNLMRSAKLKKIEKRIYCKPWTMKNINWIKKLMLRELIKVWLWVNSEIIQINNLKCNINTLKNFRKMQWLNSKN